jgi:hypothetical protein
MSINPSTILTNVMKIQNNYDHFLFEFAPAILEFASTNHCANLLRELPSPEPAPPAPGANDQVRVNRQKVHDIWWRPISLLLTYIKSAAEGTPFADVVRPFIVEGNYNPVGAIDAIRTMLIRKTGLPEREIIT